MSGRQPVSRFSGGASSAASCFPPNFVTPRRLSPIQSVLDGRPHHVLPAPAPSGARSRHKRSSGNPAPPANRCPRCSERRLRHRRSCCYRCWRDGGQSAGRDVPPVVRSLVPGAADPLQAPPGLRPPRGRRAARRPRRVRGVHQGLRALHHRGPCEEDGKVSSRRRRGAGTGLLRSSVRGFEGLAKNVLTYASRVNQATRDARGFGYWF